MPEEHQPLDKDKFDRAATVYAQYLAGQDGGQDSSIDELCRRVPELDRELRRLHQAHERVDEALLDMGLPGSTASSVSESSIDGHSLGDAELLSEVVERLSNRTGAFGRYRLQGELARGGMGSIMRVWDEDLRRHLAMKVMLVGFELEPKDDAARRGVTSLGRFLEEAQVTSQLDHPGIVPVHELGLDPEGRVYFTMRLVKGMTFEEVLGLVAKGAEGWSLTRALHILLSICDAVSYAHAKGVIHRDLKPSNIMVGRFGEVYVMDWGLAKIMGRAEQKDVRIRTEPKPKEADTESQELPIVDPETPLYTMDGDVVGTPAYMSPEQARGRIDEIGPHSDVYSVGSILYHLLRGRMPYDSPGAQATNIEILRRLQAGPPDALGTLALEVPPELVSICEKSMRRDVAKRFANVKELAGELRAYLEGRVVRAHKTGLTIELRKWVARNRLATGAMAAAAIILLVSGVALVWIQRTKLLAIEAEQLQTQLARGKAEEAAKLAKSAAAAALEQEKENLVIKAEYAIDNAHLQEAEVLMAEYRGLDPTDSLPHLVMARGYSQFLRGAEAEEEFSLAQEKGYGASIPEADDAHGLYLRGLALMIQRDPAGLGEAIRCLSEAIELDPKLRGAYLPLYTLNKQAGNMAKAESALGSFQKSLATGDDYYQVVEAILAELQGRFQDGVEVLLELEQQVGEERVRDLRLNRILGRLHLAIGLGRNGGPPSRADLDEAYTRLEAAVEAVPSDAATWANLGTLDLKRYTEAPGSPNAETYLRRALQHGQRAVVEYPKFAAGHRIVLNALVFLATRNFDPDYPNFELLQRAEEVADRLRTMDPDHPSLNLMEAELDKHQGMVAHARGDAEEAELLYRRSLQNNPNQVLVRFWLSERELGLENYQAAFDSLQAARLILARYRTAAAVLALPDKLVMKIHIWTFDLAGRLQTPQAIEEGLRARADIEVGLSAGRETEAFELLRYAEGLATSPAAELRDCAEAERVIETFELSERLKGTSHEEALHSLLEALPDCE